MLEDNARSFQHRPSDQVPQVVLRFQVDLQDPLKKCKNKYRYSRILF